MTSAPTAAQKPPAANQRPSPYWRRTCFLHSSSNRPGVKRNPLHLDDPQSVRFEQTHEPGHVRLVRCEFASRQLPEPAQQAARRAPHGEHARATAEQCRHRLDTAWRGLRRLDG